MNDRKLLKLAAKAAGYKVTWAAGFPGGGVFMRTVQPEPPAPYSKQLPWDPLSDDGDALRLAVLLDMRVQRFANMTTASKGSSDWQCDERDDGDPYSATRRAIVRVAAWIEGAGDAQLC